MEKIEAQKVYYEIQELLGSGLTSDVYKAFRVDAKGWTSQEVALKIIKSQNDVQILKKEFERLLRIRSKYCVNILAWESLKQGPALVLEFIDGMTLHQLINQDALTENLIFEIIAQVQMGLKALHKLDIYHGDLNLKNIMINREGVVKLIDFGFQGSGDTQCLTPQFSSPERMTGIEPNSHSDLYSLEKVAEYLFQKWGEHRLSDDSLEVMIKDNLKLGLEETSRASRRRSLAKKVSLLQQKQSPSTQRIERSKGRGSNKIGFKIALSSLAFFVTLMFPFFQSVQGSYAKLSVRGQHWFKISINQMPYRYGPIVNQKLRVGKYNVRWQNAKASREFSMDLTGEQTFLLQPDPNSL